MLRAKSSNTYFLLFGFVVAGLGVWVVSGLFSVQQIPPGLSAQAIETVDDIDLSETSALTFFSNVKIDFENFSPNYLAGICFANKFENNCVGSFLRLKFICLYPSNGPPHPFFAA